MVGSVGANLKGIDLAEGADDLRHALIDGSVQDLATRPDLQLPDGPAPAAPAATASSWASSSRTSST